MIDVYQCNEQQIETPVTAWLFNTIHMGSGVVMRAQVKQVVLEQTMQKCIKHSLLFYNSILLLGVVYEEVLFSSCQITVLFPGDSGRRGTLCQGRESLAPLNKKTGLAKVPVAFVRHHGRVRHTEE